jgi:hypothetical protein
MVDAVDESLFVFPSPVLRHYGGWTPAPLKELLKVCLVVVSPPWYVNHCAPSSRLFVGFEPIDDRSPIIAPFIVRHALRSFGEGTETDFGTLRYLTATNHIDRS